MRWFFFTTWWRGGRSMPVHSTEESEVIWWKWKWSHMMTRFSIVSMPAQDDQRSTMLCWKYPRCLQIAPLLAMYRLLRCLYYDQQPTSTLVTCFLAYVGLLAILRRSRRRSQVTEAFEEVFSSLEAHPREPFGRCYAHWTRSQQNKNKRQWSRWMAFGKEFAELSSKLNCWANAKEMTG